MASGGARVEGHTTKGQTMKTPLTITTTAGKALTPTTRQGKMGTVIMWGTIGMSHYLDALVDTVAEGSGLCIYFDMAGRGNDVAISHTELAKAVKWAVQHG